MSLLDLYNKNQQELANKKVNSEEERRKKLAQGILSVMENNDRLYQDIEKILISDGSVMLTGFGCLCQSGFCTWQKGFENYMTDFHSQWKEKGVSIYYRIDGISFNLQGVGNTSHRQIKISKDDYINEKPSK